MDILKSIGTVRGIRGISAEEEKKGNGKKFAEKK